MDAEEEPGSSERVALAESKERRASLNFRELDSNISDLQALYAGAGTAISSALETVKGEGFFGALLNRESLALHGK